MKELRAAILRMRSYGDSMGEIAKNLRIPKATMQKAIQRGTVEDRPGRGRKNARKHPEDQGKDLAKLWGDEAEEFEEEWTYQQDTALSHKAKETQAWLRKNAPDFITIKEWPPYSPDLNPLDYAIWGYLEAKSARKTPRIDQVLEESHQEGVG
uniref:Transposase n=1 Tax=Acrobeloides nanus TaxID=290746 RepID=A0A914EMG0_9BILA